MASSRHSMRLDFLSAFSKSPPHSSPKAIKTPLFHKCMGMFWNLIHPPFEGTADILSCFLASHLPLSSSLGRRFPILCSKQEVWRSLYLGTSRKLLSGWNGLIIKGGCVCSWNISRILFQSWKSLFVNNEGIVLADLTHLSSPYTQRICCRNLVSGWQGYQSVRPFVTSA